MDIQPTNQQPMTDDQELAKVLAGITAGADGAAPSNLASDLNNEASDAAAADEGNNATTPVSDMPVPGADPAAATTTSFTPPAAPEPTSFTPPTPPSVSAPAMDSGLEAIKHDALNELRPLVDKLNLSAEEKFDTYLLLIRSTDDTTLVGPAFEAARSITDETEKAQALLDIVKEIDYLSNPQKQEA